MYVIPLFVLLCASTISTHILVGGESMENLKEDWCMVKNIAYQIENKRVLPSVDITKTSITKTEFKKLMSADMSDKDLDALFSLYDYDHDGTITWREYICVITLLMAGSVKDKVRRTSSCVTTLNLLSSHLQLL